MILRSDLFVPGLPIRDPLPCRGDGVPLRLLSISLPARMEDVPPGRSQPTVGVAARQGTQGGAGPIRTVFSVSGGTSGTREGAWVPVCSTPRFDSSRRARIGSGDCPGCPEPIIREAMEARRGILVSPFAASLVATCSTVTVAIDDGHSAASHTGDALDIPPNRHAVGLPGRPCPGAGDREREEGLPVWALYGVVRGARRPFSPGPRTGRHPARRCRDHANEETRPPRRRYARERNTRRN